jgi:SNF2 family DNA or RNA helicase
MHVGKTLQVLSFFCCLRDRFSITGPHLVVMPLSVTASWRGDIDAYCSGAIRCYVHGGSKEDREVNFESWVAHLQETNSSNSGGDGDGMINVCLASYDMVLRDFHLFSNLMSKKRLHWAYVVVSTCQYVCGIVYGLRGCCFNRLTKPTDLRIPRPSCSPLYRHSRVAATCC